MQKNVLFSAALFAASSLCTVPSSAAVKQVPHLLHVRHATTGSIRPLGSAGEFIAAFSTIRAIVNFTDDGTTLTANGFGVGFNPGLTYTSFFYGAGSFSRGSLACIPPTPNNLTVPQMVTAYWLPLGASTRTLYVANTGTSYAPLSALGTFSVRYDSTPTVGTLAQLSATNPPTPARFWLNSCGRIHTY